MYTGKKAKRGKVRIKFVQRSPEISYRLTNQLESTKVKLYDISETGFSFTINEKDEVTRVGDILFIDFNQLNGGHSTCFTARVKRFQVVEDKLIFAAEFISISKSFQLQIAKWSRVYVKTGYFLLERRSPISNILRVSKKPMQFVSMVFDEIIWKMDVRNNKALKLQPLKVAAGINRSLVHSIDFEQI